MLSGGGSLGSFQIGAIKRLCELGYEYDMFYGTSVGAINSACLAMYNNLKDGHAALEKFWLNVETSDVKKHWVPFSFAQGYFKGGLYNSAPLRDLIRKNFDQDRLRMYNKKLGVCAVNLQTTEAEIFTDESEHIVDGIIASAITPFFLDPIEIGEDLYIDGGIRHNIPIQAAIDAGATMVDVIATEPLHKDPMPKSTKLMDVGMEIIGIMAHQIANNDIELAVYKNPDIEINIIRPDRPLEGETLDFSIKTIKKQMAAEYYAAEKVMG